MLAEYQLVTTFLAAGVVALFEGIIAKTTILAGFLPVVAGLGGNAGAQSLAVVMRGIVMREIPAGKRLKLILKEGRLGAINGAIIGAVTTAAAWLWMGSPFLGLVTGLGMLVNLFFAGLSLSDPYDTGTVQIVRSCGVFRTTARVRSNSCREIVALRPNDLVVPHMQQNATSLFRRPPGTVR